MIKKNVTKNPGIYIHIPFCDTKCGYCDFYSITNHASRSAFVSALIKEICHYTSKPFTGTQFDTIYFGGGTPSLLEPAELQIILTKLYSSFNIADNCEITIEVNPGTLTKEKLEFYKSMHIHRLSIGIQSFIDNELKFLGRIHDSGQAIKTFQQAREAGFDNISIDLIFAIPGQSFNNWIKNLEQAIILSPEHISAYNLIFEEGTPFYKRMMKHEIEPKSENEEVRFYQKTIRHLSDASYVHYEVSNFSKNENYYSRHNYKYWNHTNYLSFGPSAHSYWNKKRWSNVRSISHYIKNINSNISVIDFSESLSKETMIFEKIMLGLRTREGLDTKDFENTFQESFDNRYKVLKSDLLKNDFAEYKNGVFKLTSKGLMICDEILPRFAPN